MTSATSHALVEVPPGSLLLDLDSGSLLTLNESATLVWRLWLSGQSHETIAEALSTRYRISRERSSMDTGAALNISTAIPPNAEQGEFHYARGASGYVLSRFGEALLSIDAEGRSVARCAGVDITLGDAQHTLQGLAPKILSLRGETVLHGAAVAVDGGIIVLSGESGAGKTTTARALVRAGASAVSEDKVVVRVTSTGTVALLDGERRIRAWAQRSAPEICGGGPASCEGLNLETSSAVLPVREVVFLAASRRHPGPITTRPLAPLDAAGALFRNSFYGSDSGADWQRQLDVVAALARQADSCELTVPDSLERLSEACTAIIRRGSVRG